MKNSRNLWVTLGVFAILVIIAFGTNTKFLKGSVSKFTQIKQDSSLLANASNIIRSSDLIPADKATAKKMKDIISEKKRVVSQKIKKENDKEQFNEMIEGQLMPFPKINSRINLSTASSLGENNASPSSWTHLGIKGVGVIRAVDYDRNNPSHLLMATPGHLYQTFNLGNSWQQLDFPPNNMQAVGIDPNNGGHYLVLAGERSLFESKDSGATWQLIHQFDYSIGGRSIYWSNNNIHVLSGITNYISADNGTTWQEFRMLPDMASNPAKMTPSGFGLIEGQNALYKTGDFGRTWNRIFTFPAGSQYAPDITPFDISNNGRFVLTSWTNNAFEVQAAKSLDGGLTWEMFTPVLVTASSRGIFYNKLQDIVIDPGNLQHVITFPYMGDTGIYESFDQGSTFSLITVQNYENMTVFPQAGSNNSIIIVPLDLRFGGLRIVNLGNNSGDAYLAPTDQGLFLYNVRTQNFKNLVSSLYLGDTGLQIGITSCPTIYSGLWHVGHFLINSDGTIEGNNDGELNRGAVGQNIGCKTPAIVSGMFGVHYYEGSVINNAKQSFLRNISPHVSIDFQSPLIFHNGWWYAVEQNTTSSFFTYNFVRFDKDLQVKQTLSQPITSDPFSFYIDTSASTPTYWIIDKWTAAIWKSDDLNMWTPVIPAAGSPESSIKVFAAADLLLWNNSSSMLGLYVSQNGGATKNLMFPHMYTSNVVQDSNGRLFVGVFPGRDPYSDNLNMNGVWYSTDKGTTWNRFGTGSEKSIVTGLTIDNFTNTLYATTLDESIMKISLGPIQKNTLPVIIPPAATDSPKKPGPPSEKVQENRPESIKTPNYFNSIQSRVKKLN